MIDENSFLLGREMLGIILTSHDISNKKVSYMVIADDKEEATSYEDDFFKITF